MLIMVFHIVLVQDQVQLYKDDHGSNNIELDARNNRNSEYLLTELNDI